MEQSRALYHAVTNMRQFVCCTVLVLYGYSEGKYIQDSIVLYIEMRTQESREISFDFLLEGFFLVMMRCIIYIIIIC